MKNFKLWAVLTVTLTLTSAAQGAARAEEDAIPLAWNRNGVDIMTLDSTVISLKVLFNRLAVITNSLNNETPPSNTEVLAVIPDMQSDLRKLKNSIPGVVRLLEGYTKDSAPAGYRDESGATSPR